MFINTIIFNALIACKFEKKNYSQKYICLMYFLFFFNSAFFIFNIHKYIIIVKLHTFRFDITLLSPNSNIIETRREVNLFRNDNSSCSWHNIWCSKQERLIQGYKCWWTWLSDGRRVCSARLHRANFLWKICIYKIWTSVKKNWNKNYVRFSMYWFVKVDYFETRGPWALTITWVS